MTTITVEDGTIVANANSYVSQATLTTYATARGITLVTATDILLIKAMDYIENLMFIGTKLTNDQLLQWPRFGVVIDGYYQNSENIPQILKNGLMECAIAIDQDNDPLQNTVRQVKKERVDTLEIEYADKAVNSDINNRITNYLKKLLLSGAGANIASVGRG